MNVKTQGVSRRYSRRVPVRLVIEIRDGCVYSLTASKECEVAILDRDVEKTLAEGDPSFACVAYRGGPGSGARGVHTR